MTSRQCRRRPAPVRREETVTARTSHRRPPGTIPEATVARLPDLPAGPDHPRRARASPPAPARSSPSAAGVNSAKLRKDLSYLGSYGTRGVGYDVDYLRYQIAREIGVTQDWPVVIVGIGNLGPRAGQLLRLPQPRLPGRRPARRRPDPPRRDRRRRRRPPLRATSSRSSREHGVAIGVIATPAARGPGRRRPDGRCGHHQHPQLRADRARGARRASTSARSTCPSSCRSSPTTSSARPRRAARRTSASARVQEQAI